MSFTQPEYGVLLVATFWIYWALRHRATLRELVLLLASYVCYGAWNPRYVPLLALATLVDYGVGRGLGALSSPAWRRALLVASLTFNLGLLAVFKYYGFFAGDAAAVLRAFGLGVYPPILDLALPLGISFFTFQSMNYVIDVYRGVLPPCRSLLEFAVFLSFFPHLMAGPILRASVFLPQVRREPVYDDAEALGGLYRILVGLIKKTAIADFVGVTLVDPVFADIGQASAAAVLLALYAYAVQIYCDFSGYSDIAIGSARMLGFQIPENFDRPYAASSVREFWRRWHMSLSSWLRDYLYVPLGGSRGTPARTAANLMVTMLLGGLWHGASWTFVAWGGLHGLGLVVERFTGRSFGRFVTFHFVCLAWLFFRAGSLDVALAGLRSLAGLSFALSLAPGAFLAAGVVALALALHFAPAAWKEALGRRFVAFGPPLQAAAAVAVLVLVLALSAAARPFLYFQF